MRSKTKMLTATIIIALSIILFPIKIILAAETTNQNLEIVQTNNNEYIIYIQDLQKTQFNYAISANKETKEMELKYIHSTKDSGDNQVVLVDKSIYDFAKDSKAYLWVKNGEKQIITAKEIDFSKSFSKSKVEEVENTTKRINTEIISNLLEEEKTDENGVKITIKVGGIEIKDEENAQYYYQIIPATSEDGKLMTLAEKLKNDYNQTDMYQKIQIVKKFDEKYQELITKANWQTVENMQIKQPKEATENFQYIVLIKKVKENTETYDVQFLTSKEELNPTYEREKKIVQETAKLPITGDNLAILILAIVTSIALIFVVIKMKKTNNKNRK